MKRPLWCCLGFHKWVTETIWYGRAKPAAQVFQYCRSCDLEAPRQIAAEKKRVSDFNLHENLFGPILAISLSERFLPEWCESSEGSYWFTCPEEHKHLKIGKQKE